ncbi:LysR family transcriptional regulator [Aquibaculum arenosum]|uniref:LysR family transcriptional regulator n=1 Tax=Aquibaculum arenosum TaxID=3032591 RepID=A0ABT5YRJ9_9PROT|nr:LysR family transcriptional regulator [Fodinicurvata sp. CAU 1616]MDF2097514.1 LysR family transcriptional regulator [Fodinicurvata sp. CAU 1616]
MDRLEAMSIFLTVVETGSLAAASRKLGRSPASVTRAIAQLEESAGVRLIERTTRRFAVTEAGTRHVETYRKMLNELAHLEERSSDANISGTVVVTAPELFGRMRVMPVIESFLALYPETQARLLLMNRVVDLVGEGVDVAIRLADLPDSSMTAIKVGEIRRLTCAAPSYLAHNAPPTNPCELAFHSCIGLNEAGSQELWRYRAGADGRRNRSVRVRCRLTLNSAGAAIDAAERGMGIVRPLSYQVERQMAAGTLVSLLDEYEPKSIPVHLVFQPRPFHGGALRAFIDHAAPLLRQSFGTDLL